MFNIHLDEAKLPQVANKLLLPRSIVRNHLPPIAAFKMLVPWLRFLCQKSVSVYWDEWENMGVKVRKAFERHDVIEALNGFGYPLTFTTLQAQRPKNARFSLLRGDVYLAGPAGLINHACEKHSTCILHFNDWKIEVNVSRLDAGARVYYRYSDEDDMKLNRGFSCSACRYLSMFRLVNCNLHDRSISSNTHSTDAFLPIPSRPQMSDGTAFELMRGAGVPVTVPYTG